MASLVNFKSLLEIPGFESLDGACQKFSIDFTLFGSAVRRIVKFVNYQQPLDIFNYAPYTSDFDLLHSGKPELLPEIINYLSLNFPYFECFRWQIRSESENATYEQAILHNHIIPANLMRLSTNPQIGFTDVWNGESDVINNNYRFILNGFYKQSPLYNQDKDLEFFAAILYLSILLEEDLSLSRQPSYHELVSLLNTQVDVGSVVESLNRSQYLRTRFRYLLRSLVGRAHRPSDIYQICNDSGLKQLIRKIDNYGKTIDEANEISYSSFALNFNFNDELVISKSHVAVTSAHLGGDLFRLPIQTGKWMEENYENESYKFQNDSIRLAPDQSVILVSPKIPFQSGKAICGHLSSAVIHEFIYFSIRLQNDLSLVKDEDLSAFIAIGSAGNYEYISIPCVCQLNRGNSGNNLIFPDYEILRIRINVGAIFELAHDYFSRNSLDFQLFVVKFNNKFN